MNFAARVKLIEHLTSEQSNTRIKQLLRYGANRPVLRAKYAGIFSTITFAISVLEAKYF